MGLVYTFFYDGIMVMRKSFIASFIGISAWTMHSMHAMEKELPVVHISLPHIITAYTCGATAYWIKMVHLSEYAILTKAQMSYLNEREKSFVGFYQRGDALILKAVVDTDTLDIRPCSKNCWRAVVTGTAVTLPCIVHGTRGS